MTTIRAKKNRATPKERIILVGCSILFGLIAIIGLIVILSIGNVAKDDNDSVIHKQQQQQQLQSAASQDSCLQSMSEMTQEELHPTKGKRHMVQPPAGGRVTLVCCHTTVGDVSIAVHSNWAPLGAERFLTMVRSGYFSTKVALMRCLKNFICQFGIAGDPTADKPYKNNNLQDDPNWLPEGPKHRENEDGVLRFAQGYLAYAGGGKNSRSNQFIVALKDNRGLGGGSPWEVPWGELVGHHSFDTISKIYTGYGDNGPSQGLLHREGSSAAVAEQFPKLDYITSCDVVDEQTF